MSSERNRLVDVALNEASLAPASPNVEQERRIALFDLKEGNTFGVVGADDGPYVLALAVSDGRLEFDVANEAGGRVVVQYVPLSTFRKLIKDYFMICASNAKRRGLALASTKRGRALMAAAESPAAWR